MKNIITILIVAFVLVSACNQPQSKEPDTSLDSDDSIFNAALAEKLGADNYGMRQYVMAFLKAGDVRNQDLEEATRIQAGHMAHIRKMSEDGHLVLAGPFLDGGEIRGIFLFAVDSLEEAQALTEADPAVQSGRLIMELHPWYGSAALLKVNEIHQTIAKEQP
jgi:uncharacterized protein YciI